MNTGTKTGTSGTRGLLTPKGIAAMKPGTWAADPAMRGAGRLQVRKLAGGEVAFYYRYTGPGGERVRLPIGSGLSLRDARRRADDLSRRYQAGERDLRAVLDAEQREAARQREAEQRAAEVEVMRQRASLGALLTAYVAQLVRDGKPSARSVERTLRRHVETAWPKLWRTPAEDVSTDDLLAVVAKLADAGKLREAAKLRAYLRAAYAAAIRARQDARGLPALRQLKVTANPARDLVTIDGANNARDRALTLAELRAYWKRVQALPDPDRALLAFHLLTGGQRVEQLGRLTVADYDPDRKAVRLRDAKGRRKIPRLHEVPLIPPAVEAMQAMQGGALGPFLFTVTAGQSGAAYATLRQRIATVAAAMVEAGEASAPFTAGDLRRTVETRLAALGVGADVRARLQSHGLGGVQARHYDRHDYAGEVRAALERLYGLLSASAAKVTPIRRRRG